MLAAVLVLPLLACGKSLEKQIVDGLSNLDQARFGKGQIQVEKVRRTGNHAVAEVTLLTLAPLDLELDLDLEEDDDDDKQIRRLVVLASSDGPVADLEFIGGGNEENLEDRIRQLQLHDTETVTEQELSLQLLRRYASSVKHQQYHDGDIITVRVGPPGTR